MNLVVQEIPVDYEFVQQNVPRLWTGGDEGDGNGVLALIHVGVSGIASKITIETRVCSSTGSGNVKTWSPRFFFTCRPITPATSGKMLTGSVRMTEGRKLSRRGVFNGKARKYPC